MQFFLDGFTLRRLVSTNLTAKVSGAVYGPPVDLVPSGEKQELFHPWPALVYNFMRGRTVFKTLGDYLGIGLSDIEKDDVVAVIFGLRTPLVLRHVEDACWRIIGDAYVPHVIDRQRLKGLSQYTIQVV